MTTHELIARAQALMGVRQYQRAVEVLRPVFAEDPDHATAWCLMAQCELGLGEPGRARDAARRAVRGAPQSEWPRRLLSIAYMRCHAYPDALAEAQAAVACAPNEWRTHLQLASVDFAAKDVHERTRRAAQRAVELAPDESEAHFVLAQVHFAQKDYSAARAQFLETLRLDPDNGPARNNLAVIDIRRRKWISAIPHLIGALRLDPSSQVSAANLRTVLRFWVFLVAIVGGLGESIISGSIHDHVSSTSVVTSPHGRTAPLVGLAAALIGAFVVVAAILRITVGRRVVPILAASMRVDRLLGASIAIVVAEVGLMVVAVSVGLPAARGWVTASAVCAFVVLALRIGSIVRSRRKPATIRVPLRQVR